ncbi:MAG: helix-hairpin-helix domain-containing protein [Gammaproteobacteria bacterium]|nr:helix-hairpin-helix domain-containing protein [Gammaproteobacteria bacterium]MBD3776936.1 helix-hairpin-helix domain-containing protein [Thiotrichales bacterium]
MLSKTIKLALGFWALSGVAMAAPVNVNTATSQEISAALSGIGPAKAEAISQYCKVNTCTKPEDLLKVKGIGEKTLEKIKADLRFDQDKT